MRYTYVYVYAHACAALLYACAPLIDGMDQATPSATGLPLMLSSQVSYVIVSGFRAALDLDTYPLSNLIRPRGRGKPVLIMHIGFFACFAKSPHYFSCPCSTEAVGIAHKPPGYGTVTWYSAITQFFSTTALHLFAEGFAL